MATRVLPYAILSAFAVAILAAERIWPATSTTNYGRRLARNAVLGAIGIAIGPLLLAMQRSLYGGISPLIDLSSVPGGVLLQFIAFDVWVYATHRAYHELRWLWPLHAPHHFDKALDASSAVRFHPFELLVSAVLRIVPCLAIGISPGMLLVFESILVAAALFHHSNLRLPPRFEAALSRLIVTPSIHWVHHHDRRTDTDSNYGALLSIWDPLFGSRSATVRTATMPIGTEGEHERSLAGLLAYPVAALRRLPRDRGDATPKP